MPSAIDRRTALRIGLLSSLGWALGGCGGGSVKITASVPPVPQPPASVPELLVFRKNHERYAELAQRFNTRLQRSPAMIVLCRTAAEVAAAVSLARREGLPVAVKSGGHSFEAFSSNDGGLVIDLSLMDGVTWLDPQTVRVGPALTLAGLYDALLPRGQLVPAGSCGSVGLGGLTLGGGYGLFSRRFGLTCDSLLEARLVDGRGALRSSRDDNTLLWACRGGANGNFGAVTSMTFRTHPAPAGLYSHRFKAFALDPGRACSLLREWCALASGLPLSAFSAFVLNGRTLTVLITDTENDDPGLRGVLAELERRTDKASYGVRQDLPTALRRYYGVDHPLPFKNSSAGFYDGYADLEPVFADIAAIVGSCRGMIFQVNTLGGLVADPELARWSAFPHRRCPFLGELQAYYERPTQAPAVVAASRQVHTLLRQAGVHRHYRNYPDLDLQDWGRAYYGAGYGRLQEVKRRYDPDDLFRHPQSVRV